MRPSALLSLLVGCALLAPPATAGVACDCGDGDGVLDANDNCIEVPNAAPFDCDTDNDNYGNACDGDFDQDGGVNTNDFVNHFLPDFQAGSDGGTGTDMDCSGSVNATDFSDYFLIQFQLGMPGPSCCAP